MKMIKQFFSRPDWMLHKGVFVFIVSLPILYATAIGVFASRSIHSLKAFQTETILLEKVLKNINYTKSLPSENVDNAYVKNFLEKLTFLSEDCKQLSFLYAEVDEKDLYNGIKQRLVYLENGENRLDFVSKNKGADLVWNILHPVEMSYLDIQQLVTNVEGKALGKFFPHPNRPNLFFSSLKFTKLEPRSTDVFTVDLQIIQKRSP